MIAATFHGPGDLRLEEREEPQAHGGDVVLTVQACGLCGTDLKIFDGNHRAYPAGTVRVPGHEIVGDVVEFGAEADRTLAGQRVIVAPNIACGRCAVCRSGGGCVQAEAFGITRDGGLATHLLVPAVAVEQGALIPLDGMSAASATLLEPLSAVLRSHRPLGIGNAAIVTILGGGATGLLHAIASKAAGVDVVILSDNNEIRRRRAVELGVDVAAKPGDELVRSVDEQSSGRGSDVVIVAAPVPSLVTGSMSLAARAGRVSLFAGMPADAAVVPIDVNEVHYREISLYGSAGNTPQDLRLALEFVTEHNVDLSRLVTGRFALDDIDAGVAAARDRAYTKVVIEPNSSNHSHQ